MNNVDSFHRLLILQANKYDDQIGLDGNEERELTGLIKYFEVVLEND